MADGESIAGETGSEVCASNPYLERCVARMGADDAWGRLQRHWSVRCGRVVERPAVLLERFGCDRVAGLYLAFVAPLLAWLERRQSAFVRGML